MYSQSDMLTTGSDAGKVWNKIKDVKKNYLPRVGMSEDFDETWSLYMQQYEACQPEIFFEEMQRELERRIEAASN